MSNNHGEAVYIVFDGPPGHESGRFVETEARDGRGVRAGEWEKTKNKLWRLGPFVTAKHHDELLRDMQELLGVCPVGENPMIDAFREKWGGKSVRRGK